MLKKHFSFPKVCLVENSNLFVFSSIQMKQKTNKTLNSFIRFQKIQLASLDYFHQHKQHQLQRRLIHDNRLAVQQNQLNPFTLLQKKTTRKTRLTNVPNNVSHCTLIFIQKFKRKIRFVSRLENDMNASVPNLSTTNANILQLSNLLTTAQSSPNLSTSMAINRPTVTVIDDESVPNEESPSLSEILLSDQQQKQIDETSEDEDMDEDDDEHCQLKRPKTDHHHHQNGNQNEGFIFDYLLFFLKMMTMTTMMKKMMMKTQMKTKANKMKYVHRFSFLIFDYLFKLKILFTEFSPVC